MINGCKFLQIPCGDFLKVFQKVSTDLSNTKRNHKEIEFCPVVSVPSALQQCRDFSQVVQTFSTMYGLNHVLWPPASTRRKPINIL
ncbi:hypothetical protein CEXT_267921 [Caerostris extrusa]|uniref:Uncharacterized protein n=1 Tax=Caerostris extrusa TaxID=172846 RepID=A0AAV4TPM7_CAEEX|nr:hypothetical protein CEXT_267921 [Caerostris extrusa]